MDDSTRQRLNAINRDFYTEHAGTFARTRNHPWPGWERALRAGPQEEPLRVLDVGCGNGRFGHFLAEQAGRRVAYTGVDLSPALLEETREQTTALFEVALEHADWVREPPQQALPKGPFGLVVAYGVLHHVPAHAKRKELLEVMGQRLSPGGILVATFWRFGAPELATRYRHRLLSFAADKTSPAFIDPEQLEAGDCLLQWGDDPSAFRYCHYCDDAEIDALVGDLRLARVDSFVADGRSGDLNRYEILRRER